MLPFLFQQQFGVLGSQGKDSAISVQMVLNAEPYHAESKDGTKSASDVGTRGRMRLLKLLYVNPRFVGLC